MSVYDSMRNRLLTTGLYTLDGKTDVDFELRAYAAGLDPAVEALKVLKRESFVPTAETYGLTEAEILCGQDSPSESSPERRKRLLAVNSVTADDDTPEDIRSLMNALGFQLTVTSDPRSQTVTYHITGVPSGSRASLQRELDGFAPAHLNVVYEFPDGNS